MLVAVVALIVSQAVLALLLFGTEVIDRHPLVPREVRRRRTLRTYRRRMERLGGAVERARLG